MKGKAPNIKNTALAAANEVIDEILDKVVPDAEQVMGVSEPNDSIRSLDDPALSDDLGNHLN